MEQPKKTTLGGIKNWLVLGAVGFAGYYGYRYFTKHEEELKKEIKAVGRNIPGPDLNGPPVAKFTIASTKTRICIPDPVKGFVYAPITSVNAMTGYNTFSATASGNFTRRLLCRGSQRWAEIRPTVSGALGDILDDTFGSRS